jgi:hypothetical protein
VGLRGPAPVIRRVTPATLAPGDEYDLELEGAELTPSTEIFFPAPLALLKKATILSSTRAKAFVFVPITAGSGPKAVSVWNEYGKSSGPGQVTIAPPMPTHMPVHGTPTLADSVKKPGQFQARIVTFTCPAGGESWLPRTPIQITYSCSFTIQPHWIMLYKDDVYVGQVGAIRDSYNPGQTIILDDPAGTVWDLSTNPIYRKKSVPPGSGYRYAISETNYEGDPMAFSNTFTILDIGPYFSRYNKIYYGPLPNPGECPECIILDLPGLHEEMVNFGETMKAGLYWQGKAVANLGTFGKGQGFPAKLQVKLEPEALAAVKHGEEFELRIFDGTGGQLHSQKTQLVLLPGSEQALLPFSLIPDPPPNPNPPPNNPANPTMLKLFKFTGYAHLYPAGNTFRLVVSVHQNNQPVPNLKVQLMDTPAPENQNHPGKYECLISNFTPVQGSTVSVTFDKIPKIPGANKLNQTQLVAQATIGQLIAISSPLADAHVDLSTPLSIEWRGGNPPYYIAIVAYLAHGLRDTVYHREGVAGTSLSVNLQDLGPGTKYDIIIVSTMEEFRFRLSETADPRSLSLSSQMVDPGSQFHLSQAATVSFFSR